MDILELVGITVDHGDVAAWNPLQVVDAEAYAMAVHFHASDNSVTVPPMPEHLRLAILRANGGTCPP